MNDQASVLIIGKQQPRDIREHMGDMIRKAGYHATLMDMPTRNTADWAEALEGYDVIISAGEKFPAQTIKRLHKLKLISRFGVGTDEIDHEAATSCGIAVCNAAGTLSTAVAECAIGLMINLLRSFHKADAEVRKGDWSRFLEGRNGGQLEGKTVGLIGFGDIAKALAKMLNAFDCHVLAFDLNWDAKAAYERNVEYAEISKIQKESDIISLHIPSTKSTAHMVNKEFLSAMKSSAILINTARGALIVEDDLANALKHGIIAAAGMDVFETEPLPITSPLIPLDNVMLLPHSGAGTSECVTRAGIMAAQNAIDFLDGKPVGTILNPEFSKS